uniref:Cytochrome c oxidase subunit 3 n=1 Tax=Trichuris muris TaxID=70415 RepID=A0A0S3M494_TRIMR|nr:cytochrome c oxidase subunit III [Trichuris muris]BAT21247.1 cytochrome c oxidase subunit III [Trichuris muris]
MKKLTFNYDSPWSPILCLGLLSSIVTITVIMKMTYWSPENLSWTYLIFNIIAIAMIMALWFRDCFRESISGIVNDDKFCSIKLGMIFFLLSEGFFFFSFFWMFTSSVLIPDLSFWPPSNLKMPSFIGAPSLNTILLVTSSATVTLSHFEKDEKNSLSWFWLLCTLVLSLLFMLTQYMEYSSLPFNFTSGVGGSIFYLATGFHGIHVILGSLLLSGCLIMILNRLYTNRSLLSYELSIWYWHFVDAIWLMLYTIFYCWGH